MAIRRLPPRDLVLQLLHYDPETGVLTWRPRPREMFTAQRSYSMWNARFAGTPAGTLVLGRLRANLSKYGIFSAHRLIWLMLRGEPVPPIIDHADRNPLNNRIANLRAATGTQNQANHPRHGNNTTGAKGVSRTPRRFRAVITLRGKQIWLGSFDTVEEAAKAYREAADRLYGEFARHE